MSRQEVRDNKLYRLLPGQRRHQTLQLLEEKAGQSHTALYVQTSPSCQRRGLTRSLGTYNDHVLWALVEAKLITCKTRYRGPAPKPFSVGETVAEMRARYDARFRRVSSYTITKTGRHVMDLLNDDRWIKFGPSGRAIVIYPPACY